MLRALLALFIALHLSVCTPAYLNESSIIHHSLRNGYEGYVPLGDLNLYYKVIGRGEPMIVLHGGPGLNHSYLLPGLAQLAKHHQVIFYDQRGTGKSIPTALDIQHINIDHFVSDLENLRKHLGLKQFILAGHSWGGMLAMQYTIKHPTHVSALILMNSLPATSKGIQAFMQEYLKRTKPLTEKLTQIQNTKAFFEGNPQIVADFFRTVFTKYCYHSQDAEKITLHFTPEDALSSFKVMNIFQTTFLTQSNLDMKSSLKKFKLPTLIIHGDSDPIPPWTALEIEKSIPQSKLVILNECGHFPYIEKPKVLFSVINTFLKTERYKK